MSDLKSFAQKLAIVLGSVLVLAGIFYGVSSYNEYSKEQTHIKNPQKIVLDQIYRFMTKKNFNICTGSFALKVYKDLEKIKNI